MAEFILKNNFVEFETKIILIYVCSPYACFLMDRTENDFLDSEIVKPWLWLRYIDDIFVIWAEGEDKLEGFLNRLNNFHPNLKFDENQYKYILVYK